MNSKIEELQKQIAQEQNKIRNCSHKYGKPYSDPETISEGYGSKLVQRGSDVWYEFEGYKKVQIPRWARKCSKCGNIEYTYKQKAIISSYAPEF